MRSVSDHLEAVLEAVVPVAPLDVVLADADGCVLARDVTATHDLPPVPLAGHDGYAVRSQDVGQADQSGLRLPVMADARPDSAQVRLVPGTAVLVAAGAPLPLGADAVVPAERTDRGRAQVVLTGSVAAGEHVRPAGQDAAAGGVVLRRGTRIAARHLAVAAALGLGRLWVHPAPRVVVVTVGDELVEPGRRSDGVHDSLGVALVAAAREAGASAVRVGPIPDDRAALHEVLADQMVRADVLLVTGGLSGGPWDTVADVLASMGEVRFDQVALTPGRRQGFGSLRAEQVDDAAAAGSGGRPGVPVFALPGHPVAALTSFEMFIRPALRSMAGYAALHRTSVTAAATSELRSPAGLRQVVPATIVGNPASGYRVAPAGDPVSLAALAGANALMIVAEQVSTVRTGDPVACMILEA